MQRSRGAFCSHTEQKAPSDRREVHTLAAPPSRSWLAQRHATRHPGASEPPSSLIRRRMGTVYAIANQKGGVGKTTTAVNVAACIAEAGYETLVVDVDPQGNATVGLGASRNGGSGLYDVLTGDVTLTDAIRATEI